MAEDSELLRQYALEQSQPAFAALVDRYLNLVYSVALRKSGGNRHRAEEIAQLVFVRLAERAGTLTGYTVLSGWLYTVAHNLAATAARDDFRRRRRETAAQLQQELMNDAPSPDWVELRPVLDEAMRQLSRADREAVLLRYFEDCGYTRIGQRLQISESGARMRVERALDRLHVLLRQRGIGSSAAALGALLAKQSVGAAPAYLAASIVGAAGGVSAVVQPLLLMSLTKTTMGILAASLLVIGWGGYELQRAMKARGELASINAQMRTQREPVAKRSAEAVADAQSKSSPNLRRATPGAAPAVSRRDIIHELEMADPEARRMVADVNRGWLNSTFGQFVLIAGLSDAQRMALYAAEMEFLREHGISSPAGGLKAVDYQLPHDQVVSIIGEAAASQLDNYLQRLPVNGVVSTAALYAGFADVPLSAVQQDQLAQLMAQSAKSDDGDQTLKIASIDWTSLSSQAQSFLNANQLQAVRGALLEAQYKSALTQAMQGPAPASGVNVGKP